MKTLELNYLETINGGNIFSDFADGLCAGWTAAQLINVVAYSNPITGTVATALNIGCGAWGVYRIYN